MFLLNKRNVVDGTMDASGRSSVLDFEMSDNQNQNQKNKHFRHDTSFCLNCSRFRDKNASRISSLRTTGVIRKPILINTYVNC